MYTKLMRRLAPAVVLGVVACCAAAAQAYEGPTWAIGETELESNKTIKAKDVSGVIFEDTKTAGGAASVECKVTGEGTIEAGGKDEVTSASATACKGVKLCGGTITVLPLHLPWHTQLEQVSEEVIRDKVTSGGSGEPGWSVECTILGIKVLDECTGATTVAAEDVTGGVDMSYDAKSARTNCTQGGAGSGVIKGTELDEKPGTESLLVVDELSLLAGTVELGPSSPLLFEGLTEKRVTLYNPAAIERGFKNGGPGTPGVISLNTTNFSVALFAPAECLGSLPARSTCQIGIRSVAVGETGEYLLLYGNSNIELKFGLIS